MKLIDAEELRKKVLEFKKNLPDGYEQHKAIIDILYIIDCMPEVKPEKPKRVTIWTVDCFVANVNKVAAFKTREDAWKFYNYHTQHSDIRVCKPKHRPLSKDNARAWLSLYKKENIFKLEH